MNTLIANLRHAARNHETVNIGGGEFGPAELLAAADAFTDMLFSLQDLLAMPDYDSTQATSIVRRQAKAAARAAVTKALGTQA